MADPNIAELIKPTYEFARHDSTSLGPSDRLANPKPGDIWLASDRKSASRIPPGVVRLRSAKAPQFSTMARLQPSTDQVGGLETPNKPPLEQFLSGDAIELGLGQRLMRATFRAAYQLLIKAETYPTIYSHCFGLSFYYCTRQQMLRLISYKVLGLAYTTEHGQSPPFIALGGAGSHYGSLGHPIRIEQGKRQPVVRPVSLNSKNFVRLVDESAPYDPGIIADLTGYEGDWFDALDVEEYLAEKNVRLELDPAPTKCNVGHDSASALFTGSKSYTTEGWRGNLSDTITIPITPPDFNGSAATSAPARLPSGTAYSRPGVSLAPRPVSQLPETISADPTSLSIRSFKFLAAWDWQAIEKAGTDRQLVPSWVPPTTAKPTTPDPSLTRIIPSPAGSNLAYGRSTTMTIDGDKFIHGTANPLPQKLCPVDYR